ncbi:alpha/beta fold hydrolase [Leptothrix ochracea]|uniref:alpha/beta fold hydrolase n=2 Tax=Leptothrix ochracea TaxID=735331 RepID=UPI0034E21400
MPHNLKVTYREAGQGDEVLVLLHGFLCDARCWRPQLTGLSQNRRVVAWDAPGAGGSEDPPAPFTLVDWSHALAAFLDRIGVERAHFLGLSWGGVLAQVFCQLYAQRVRGLILADTYAGWRGSLPAETCRLRLARCEADASLPPQAMAARWTPEMFSAQASSTLWDELRPVIADFHPAGFSLMARSLAETDTTVQLAHIRAHKVPTLLIWGENDQRSSLSIARHMHAQIPHARLVVLAQAGHLSPMECPEAFNAEVHAFLCL